MTNEIGAHESAIKNAESMIEYYNNIIAKSNTILKDLRWMEKEDLLKLDGEFNNVFVISANHGSWKSTKTAKIKKPFYLSIRKDHEPSSVGLSIESAKQLRDYLTQKIDYLEAD